MGTDERAAEEKESPEERELVAAARAGSPEARERLVGLLSDPLRGYLEGQVGSRLGRAVSISDLCQEALVESLDALRVLPSGSSVGDFRALLFQHARWLVKKSARRHRRFAGESAAASPPEGLAANQESAGPVTYLDEGAWLRRAVDRLPEDQAAVVHLRLAGRSFAEVARELGIEEEAARKRHLRASLALKRRLGPAQDGP